MLEKFGKEELKSTNDKEVYLSMFIHAVSSLRYNYIAREKYNLQNIACDVPEEDVYRSFATQFVRNFLKKKEEMKNANLSIENDVNLSLESQNNIAKSM